MAIFVPAAEAAASGNGINLIDPRFLLRGTISSASLYFRHDTTNFAATSSGFFSSLEQVGDARDSTVSADTYFDLLDSTATTLGVVGCIVGPTASGSQTTTVRITVDGTAYTIAIAVTSGDRAFIGNMVTDFQQYTTASEHGKLSGQLDANKDQFDIDTDTQMIIPWNSTEVHKMPCLIYRSTGKVEMKHSASISDGGNEENQCGLMHMIRT